jgi:hypothetical protein
MKKVIILCVVGCLTVALFSVDPARADQFWPGVAVGIGAAILLNQIVNGPSHYYYHDPPVRVYRPQAYYGPPQPVYYSPPPPVYRERWDRSHGSGRPLHYGNYPHYRGQGH